MVHHDLWDYDNAAAPQLTTIRRNGQTVDVVAQAGKTGFLYVFNRVTGEPIWPIEERPVPQSDVPGEQAWPTQPFPTNPPPFAKQSLTENEINPYILTPEQRAEWQDRIAKARKGGLFTPPAVGIETVAIPGAQGGANWGTTAANPTNGSRLRAQHQRAVDLQAQHSTAPGQGGAEARVARRPVAARPWPQGTARSTSKAGQPARCANCRGTDLPGIGNYSVARRHRHAHARRAAAGASSRAADSRCRRARCPRPKWMRSWRSSLTRGGRPAGGREAWPGARSRRPGPSSPVAERRAPSRRRAAAAEVGWPARRIRPGSTAPNVRYYTDYGMQNTLVQPPYSTLTAYDLNTGTIKWQVPAGGDEPRAIAQGGSNTGYPEARTGIITTSTGLLFHAGLDSKLRAYDAETGRVLWTGDLPAGSRGIPAMYEVNGKQYLVVSATQAGGRGGGPAGNLRPAESGLRGVRPEELTHRPLAHADERAFLEHDLFPAALSRRLSGCSDDLS